MKAVNWNTQEDMTNMFWRQNISQMWVETEFKVSKDIASWKTLTEDEKNTFKRALAGLTGLDTHQADDGMPLIMLLTTLLPSSETNYLLDTWVIEEPHLKYKSDKIISNYHKLWGKEASIFDQYMARVSSVFLETFLFYSGFYYPLYLAGQGKMTTSGEIIRKILLDESIHGVFTGLDAQSLRNELSENEKQKADKEMYKLLEELYKNEVSYTHMLYDDIGLTEDVLNYVQYNGNKALSNLGFEPYFEEKEFNPIIENALDTSTKNHDFFSVKGDGYTLALNVEALQDEDFIFED